MFGNEKRFWGQKTLSDGGPGRVRQQNMFFLLCNLLQEPSCKRRENGIIAHTGLKIVKVSLSATILPCTLNFVDTGCTASLRVTKQDWCRWSFCMVFTFLYVFFWVYFFRLPINVILGFEAFACSSASSVCCRNTRGIRHQKFVTCGLWASIIACGENGKAGCVTQESSIWGKGF